MTEPQPHKSDLIILGWDPRTFITIIMLLLLLSLLSFQIPWCLLQLKETSAVNNYCLNLIFSTHFFPWDGCPHCPHCPQAQDLSNLCQQKKQLLSIYGGYLIWEILLEGISYWFKGNKMYMFFSYWICLS